MTHNAGDEMELVHALLVFRHGDRSPITATVAPNLAMDKTERAFWISALATDARRQYLNAAVKVVGDAPVKHGGVWPNGHLTERGAEDMAEKGRALRRRYASLLTDFQPQDGHVYACSTNVRRTILSAQSLMSGLFPDNETTLQLHAKDPILLTPVHRGDEWRVGFEMARAAALRSVPGFLAFEATVKTALGLTSSGVNWTSLREVLDCRRAHDLPFPDGITDELYEAIVKHSAWEWYTFYGHGHIGQRGFAHAMHEIHRLLHEGIAKAPHRRLTLVSAHDTTLVALLCALELDQSSGTVAPPYGSTLAFDVYQHKSTRAFHLAITWDDKPLRFPTQAMSDTLAPLALLDDTVKTFLNVYRREQFTSSM
ncbi:Aste57867_23425 [Aphanomyces stellatus]|uniref:Aste57867_23425 protein n=1 Tax=Aphanomyces stellatus TaxID=120398 RepID=A0A485LNH3_9STRA|nr:hypothetical protein As57867_023354 [Aphanomyces stellatus]VFU00071.1 Aste57867_23425 [Aphanomyces stellatus]